MADTPVLPSAESVDVDAAASALPPPAARTERLVLWLFTATVFVNAALLFAVQPMISRMVLPRFGGSSAVWTTCMLFFQATLLAGYLYAHVAPRRLGLRRHAIVHLVLVAMSFATLPIAIRAMSGLQPGASPAAALLGLLTVSIGVPFFLLSSGSPLLQKWFSHTGHRSAADPYFLYAASNLGSMIALLGYPLVIEPRLRLAQQSVLWTVGYWLLAACIAGCAVLLRRVPGPAGAMPAAVSGEVVPAPAQRAWWTLLAFAPSSLLLGVTTFLTTDIAAVPLLWVVPLALYLLTFVIAFASHALLSQRIALRVQPYLLLPIVIAMFAGVPAWPAAFLLVHLLAFFVCALVCHGQLSRTRPAAEHLTEFYLWIAVGGVLGGVFNVLVAPVLFATVAEYPIALVLTALLRPRGDTRETTRQKRLDLALPVLLGIVMAAALAIDAGDNRVPYLLVIGCIAAVVTFSFVRRPLRFGLALAALLLAGATSTGDIDVLHVERSFFGVHKVERSDSHHVLVHGSTVHGAQSTDPARRLEPLTYYVREGPVGQLFAALPASMSRRVAGVGLGTGTTTCYARPGDTWTYFEIDAAVERIARDDRYFTFVRDCHAHVDVVIGDARLTLERAEPHSFDVIMLDAFSSDAIPVHLLTREAFALYDERLAEGGVIAVHVSNRHLDLQPVVAGIAADAGFAGRQQFFRPQQRDDDDAEPSAAHWIVLARSERDLGSLADDARWRPLAQRPGLRLWTDDYSNILGVFKRRWFR